MKSLKVTNLGEIRNELNKYKKGRKFDIWQFNQVARLAWLGKLTLQPLDPQDPECRSYLAYVAYPDELAAHFLEPDEDLAGHIHIVDGAQAAALAKVLEQGVHQRAAEFQALRQRDFYFEHFFDQDAPDDESPADS